MPEGSLHEFAIALMLHCDRLAALAKALPDSWTKPDFRHGLWDMAASLSALEELRCGADSRPVPADLLLAERRQGNFIATRVSNFAAFWDPTEVFKRKRARCVSWIDTAGPWAGSGWRG